MSDIDVNPQDSEADSDIGQRGRLERRASWTDLRTAMEVLLREAGSLTVDEIVDRLSDSDADLGEHFRDDPVDAVTCVMEDDTLPARLLFDDRCIYLPTLVSDRVFTHRVTELEIEHDLLPAEPDLLPIHLLASYPGYAGTVDGSAVSVVYPEDPDDITGRQVETNAVDELGSLVLPAGTLGSLGVRAGDLVTVSYSAAGLVVTVADAVADPPEAAQYYARNYTASGEPVEIDELLIELMADVPGAFSRPAPPISELLTS
ncbi:MAG: hypothetical protein QM650_10510 [Microlunatus sp.]